MGIVGEKMSRGWFNEPGRHALARRGIKTGRKSPPRRKKAPPKNDVIHMPVANNLTQKQVDAYDKAIKGFLWPNERVERGKMLSPWQDMIYKLGFVQMPYRGDYPLDMMASVLAYEPDTQFHLMVSPRAFLYESTNQSFGHPLSPDEFKASPVFSKNSHDAITARIEKGEPLDPPFLDIDWKDGEWKFVRHEGRHRALAADSLGIEKIPIIVFLRVGGKLEALQNLNDRQIRGLHKRLRGRWFA